MIHYNIVVKGKVQGVNYRARARQAAKEIGICGWVRNEDDGSVYIEAEGDEDQIQAFMEWCSEGPENAEVIEVYYESGPPKNFPRFDIKY